MQNIILFNPGAKLTRKISANRLVYVLSIVFDTKIKAASNILGQIICRTLLLDRVSSVAHGSFVQIA